MPLKRLVRVSSLSLAVGHGTCDPYFSEGSSGNIPGDQTIRIHLSEKAARPCSRSVRLFGPLLFISVSLRISDVQRRATDR